MFVSYINWYILKVKSKAIAEVGLSESINIKIIIIIGRISDVNEPKPLNNISMNIRINQLICFILSPKLTYTWGNVQGSY